MRGTDKMSNDKRTSASADRRTIIAIDKFPEDEKAILIRTCPTILTQIMLRDHRIREQEAIIKNLEMQPEQLELAEPGELEQCL